MRGVWKPVVALAWIVLLSSGAPGCGSIVEDAHNLVSDPPTIAEVEVGDEVVTVTSARSDPSRQGVAQLRAGQWAKSVALLEAARLEDPEHADNLFALGVAYEKNGQDREALDAYEAANLRYKGAGNSDATVAVRRLRRKLGQ